MRLLALGALSALTLGACLSVGSVTAQAGDYGYGGYDEPATVVTRRTVVERQVVRPQRFVREEIIERPPVYAPRRVVREVIGGKAGRLSAASGGSGGHRGPGARLRPSPLWTSSGRVSAPWARFRALRLTVADRV